MAATSGSQINLTLHNRPISDVQFNYDNDLLFVASLDSIVSVWEKTGKLKGTFEGHSGAINCMDQVDDLLLTGGSDRTAILWDVLTGKQKIKFEFGSTVKAVNIAGNLLFICCDDSFNNKPCFSVYDLITGGAVYETKLDYIVSASVTCEKYYIFGDTEGYVRKFDMKTHTEIQKSKLHHSKINEIKKSPCGKYFISSSNDATSKIFDNNLKEIKSFQATEPINSSAVFPENNILVNVGGISARDVTLTKGKRKFDVNFFDVIKEEKVGFYSTHFGTINTIDVSRDGKSFVSGGEDGIVVIVEMGDDFQTSYFTSV
ncbi:Translation initiation factor 3, subunit i (eIF-3i)/TGF-beta receptor-interacting protein (TRIP-1) [Pseudoloma neurophilia]|uniref:Serine-threonine kinase receptor-associated protein n=1 Tax=Pseudoloma neurophilia TaxID=146866 RepID=A0A0R0LUY2_9MICR|nr:Translation initiation factor 3, subunit i (eIF-3i)/TGF-beta receptor-interacting protein (TRIP-1) [Pseudoloma neurophilia]